MDKIIEIGSVGACVASLALFLMKNKNVKVLMRIQVFLGNLEPNEKINKMLINVLLGTSIVVLLGCGESNHAARQSEMAHRDMTTSFQMESTDGILNYEINFWFYGRENE